MFVEPVDIPPKLPAERCTAKWHEDDPRALIFEAENEPLHQGNAAVLANGAEAGCDPLAFTPVLERGAPELLSFVTDNVFWCHAGADDGAFEKELNR